MKEEGKKEKSNEQGNQYHIREGARIQFLKILVVEVGPRDIVATITEEHVSSA